MTAKTKPLPAAEQPEKGLPQVGNPENTVVIGDQMIEIRPTKLRYQRNRTAAFYKILEMYPVADVLAMESGAFGDDRDGDKALMDWLIAVFDDAALVTEHYDRGGNILCKVKYAYTTGALGPVQQTIPYVYSDANWKDKLTSYNGQAITYDAIGNPLNDGTWTYEWQAGRQLKRMSKPGMSVEFKYDHNGLRTQKIVTENGVSTITNYTLLGKRITHMSTGNEHLHFFYDKDNQPIKVNYNGSLYT